MESASGVVLATGDADFFCAEALANANSNARKIVFLMCG
jgi:hypothetical protein